jgi:hypothetical protein
VRWGGEEFVLQVLQGPGMTWNMGSQTAITYVVYIYLYFYIYIYSIYIYIFYIYIIYIYLCCYIADIASNPQKISHSWPSHIAIAKSWPWWNPGWPPMISPIDISSTKQITKWTKPT